MIRYNLSAATRLLIAMAAALVLLALALSPLLAADTGRPAGIRPELAAAGLAGELPAGGPESRAPAARPAGQGVDLEIQKFVQADTPPFDGSVIYNGDYITYTITVRNLTGSPILVTRVRDELTPGTLFGVECDQAGDPPCSLEVTTQSVSIPSTQKGLNLPPLPPVITTTNAVVWSNFNIAPGETKTLVFSGIVDCLPAGAQLRNAAGVTFGGSFLVSNETVTTVELRPAVINASGRPLLTGPSGCSIEVGGYDQDWGDFDQDGDLDLALATNNRAVVYRNFNGQMVQMASHDRRSFGVRWADIDGDGKLELISVGDVNVKANGFVEGKNYIFDNEVFYSPDKTFTTPDVLWRIDVADYDRDGDLDLAAASYIDSAARPRHNPCLLRLYHNDGSGSLAPEECLIGPLTKDSTWQPAITQRSYSVAWADVDRDGDQDLGVGDYGTHNRVHLNSGTELGGPSVFMENTVPAPENTTSLAWADFDNDGDPDPAWGNQNQPARLYQNNGPDPSTWGQAWEASQARNTTSVAWGGRPDRDASIPTRDDTALEYTLPFVFPFGQNPRSIIKISVNTNGMVELLQAGETCRACGSWFNTHFSNIHRSQDIDAIFAASADLFSGVLIEAVPEDNPTRVEINWLGASYSDSFDSSGSQSGFERHPLLFKVILHNSGRIEWRVFNYNFSYAYGDNFAGVYDEVADREIPVELNGGFIPSGTAAQAFLFNPADAARDWDEPVVRTMTWPGDRSIPTTDDGALTTPYALPFTNPITFYNRAITQICVNTNGLIELLEAGETTCQKGGAAYTHRSGDYANIDAIFAANDNLRTGVFVEGNAERVVVTWLGTSYYDNFYNTSAYKTNQIAFKVILSADGRIGWKFFDMNYTNYGSDPTFGQPADFFSGVYSEGEPAPVEVPGGSKSFVGYDLRRRFLFFRNPPILPVERQFALALGNYGQQNLVYRVTGTTLPAGASWTSNDSRNTTSLAWLDYNGDGFLDLAAGNFDQETVLYRASGLAALDISAVSLVPANKPVRSIAWADLDADGDLDLALGNEGQPVEVYRNQNSPNESYPYQPSMALAWAATAVYSTQSVAWADVDGDNFPDLAVGNANTPVQLYQNDGGQLEGAPLWTSLEISNTRQVAWGDVDNDGDLDLAVANDNQRNALYLNRRFFVAGNERRSLGSVNDLAWGDYDNDGFPDLAIGGVDLETPGGGFVYLVKNLERNGTRRLLFTRSGSQQVENGFPAELFDLAWGDYNRDGFLDLAATYPVGQEIRFYLNPGGGGAWTAPQVLNGLISYAIDWVDLQRDGWLDLAVADSPGTAPQLKIYLNRADSLGANNFRFNDFVTPDADLGQGAVFSLRGVDRDNDGDLDLAAVNLGRQSQMFTGFGSFLNSRLAAVDGTPTGNFSARSVAWGDYNDDGRLDLLYGGWDTASRLYRNQGAPGFCLAGSSPVTCPAGPDFDEGGQRVAIFGDFDGDNRLDIADGVPGGQVKLYRNGGTGSQTINLVEAYTMAWGDADGDGRLDLLVGGKDTAARQSYVYFNRRVEPFLDSSSPRWTLPSLEQTISVAWADYDNDNHLDFVVGNCNAGGSRSIQLYRNNRDNTFSLVSGSGLPDSGYCTRSLAWADYDGDGDPDLAVGNDNAPSFVYRNQGLYTGNFSPAWNTGTNANTRSVAWGDWNNDGKPELALGNYGQPDRVYGNFSTPAATVLIWLWTSEQAYQTTGLAWGDKDGDGDLDLAFSQNQPAAPNGIYENGYVSPTHFGARYASLPRNPTYLSVHRPGAGDAYLISSRALTAAQVPIDYTVYDAAGDSIITSPTSLYRFEYALNGGDTWRTATLSGTASHDGTALPNGQPATVTWNAAADGVVGDSVRFRITVAHHKPAGPVQYATTRATSPPFRIRSLTCQWPADPTITTRVGGQITTTVRVNQEMIFNGGLSAGTGVMTFTWNLGDTTITGQGNVPYAYVVAGTYPVTLTVVGEPCPTSREVMTRTLVTVLPVFDPQSTVYIPVIVKSGTDATAVFDPNVPRPGQVTGFSGRVGAAGTELSWTARPPAETVNEYRLYRSSRVGPAEFSLLDTMPAGTTAYTDAAAHCGYMYYVTAVNAGGESLPSISSYISQPCD